MSMACPHCGAAGLAAAQFCSACGKALPQASSGPRFVEGDRLAATAVGQAVQSDDLKKTAKKAAVVLLVVSILQLLLGGAMLAGGLLMKGDVDRELPDMLAVMGGGVLVVGVIFFGLFLWARRNPLPAAITGMVLLVSLWVIDAIADPVNIGRGIIVKLILIAALSSAISAGLKHRRLKQQQRRQASPAGA